ncbi:hypothetical protein CSW23_08595 [Thermus scotoductus]|uniref:Uncharacterized protein n=1 Tax=Thermus scotoductus TaxID=37636 RepID=A0A430V023_THESC|nr:hypothetical protein [Thermus scotoductus]RTI15432.1 hypothetical protein CSW23_08595 [Thermus scotoductus]
MVDAAQRLAELDGILTDLLGEAHLLGELPQEVSLPQEIGEDPVQLGQPLRCVYHASLPRARAAL